MNDQILEFIKENRIAVISILRPDGSVHAASIHYSYNHDPFEFYFATLKTTRKVASLLDGQSVKASMVIGFREDEMKTLQADGNIQMIPAGEELERVQSIHYEIHPFAKRFAGNPDTMFMKFIPEWWRYSAFKAEPPVFLESE